MSIPHPSVLLLLATSLLLALLARPASADLSYQLYSDAQCTVPYSSIPPVSSTQALVLDQYVCSPASTFSPTLLPGPAASSAQWLLYFFDVESTGFQLLQISTYSFSNATSQCPYSASATTNTANATIAFGYAQPGTAGFQCNEAYYTVNNATGTSMVRLYGTYNATTTSSSRNSAHASVARAGAARLAQLAAPLLLLAILAVSSI